jgi:hypothetical protein
VKASAGRRGRKPGCPPEVVRRMYRLYCLEGMTYRQIAAFLTAEGVPMSMGGLEWDKPDVVRVMLSTYGQDIGTELDLLVDGHPVRKAIVARTHSGTSRAT